MAETATNAVTEAAPAPQVAQAPVSPSTTTTRFVGIDFNFFALRTAGTRYWVFVGVLLTLILLGVLAWWNALSNGGVVMGMRDNYPWGLWFVNYMYFVGLSAGGLVVYASVHLFGAEQYRPLSRLAVFQAGILVMMALLGIITDMERPWRAGWMLLTPNPTSPFVFTGSAANIYMIICFVDLWILMTRKGGEKLAVRMTLIALPFAIYLHTTTAFVLALNKSRELWNSAVMVPIFLTSATASGIALLLLSAYIMQHFGIFKFKRSMFRSLSTLLATVIIIDLFLLIVEILTIYWPTSAKPGHVLRFNQFLFGEYAPIFLPVLILGSIAFALLAGRNSRHLPAIQITASILYVVAIFAKRWSLLGMGFVIDPLGQLQGRYVPSLTEVLIAVGLLSVGLFLLTIGSKILPLQEPEDGHEHAHSYEWLDEEPAAEKPAPEPALEAG